MYRNIYDSDSSTWSPQGRIFQIEYAVEGARHGTCAVGLRSNTHAIICCLRRSNSQLAAYHTKIHEVDKHIGTTLSGITGDARVLLKHMRNEAMGYEFRFGEKIPVYKVLVSTADKCQAATQGSTRRPFCISYILAGANESGVYLYESDSTGTFYEYEAVAIGARSQSPKTYLEENFNSFKDLSLDNLIQHGVKALNKSLTQGKDLLSVQNLSVGIVGVDEPWRELTREEMTPYLDALQG